MMHFNLYDKMKQFLDGEIVSLKHRRVSATARPVWRLILAINMDAMTKMVRRKSSAMKHMLSADVKSHRENG